MLTELTKFSSSSVEVCTCFNQVTQFWKLVDWPDQTGASFFLTELIDSLSRSVMRYATLVKENNLQMIHPSQNNNKSASNSNLNSSANNLGSVKLPTMGTTQKLDTFQKLLITANNIERVDDSLKSFPNEIEMILYNNNNHSNNKLSKQHSSNSSVDGKEKSKLIESQKMQNEMHISNASEYLMQVAEQTIELIVDNKVNPL